MLISLLAPLAVAAQPRPAAGPQPGEPAVTLAQAAASLSGRPECTAFRWLPNDQGSPRGGIAVPVVINGASVPLQLDTGANVTSLYGRYAVRQGWAAAGDATFRAGSVTVATTRLDRPQIYLNPQMDEDASLRGTLGLPALMGRIAVIDYPRQRFCLFAEPDLPAPLRRARYLRAMLRNAKLYLPIRSGEFSSDTFVFDTGSSEMPIHVDLAGWQRLTGLPDVAGATRQIRGTAWGKPFTLVGAPAAAPVMLGDVPLGRVDAFTNPDAPASFADWPVPTDGVLGNAPFWDGIVILDLTANVRFAMIR